MSAPEAQEMSATTYMPIDGRPELKQVLKVGRNYIHFNPSSCGPCAQCCECIDLCGKCKMACTSCDVNLCLEHPKCAVCKPHCDMCINVCTCQIPQCAPCLKCRTMCTDCGTCKLPQCAPVLACRLKCTEFCNLCITCKLPQCEAVCAKCPAFCLPALVCKGQCCKFGPQMECRAVGMEMPAALAAVVGEWHCSTALCPKPVPAIVYPCLACLPCGCGGSDENLNGTVFTDIGTENPKTTETHYILDQCCSGPLGMMCMANPLSMLF